MAKLRVDKIAAPIVKDEFTGSVYFDGSGDYLSIPTSDDFAFGTGDFTIEMWLYASSSGSYQTPIDFRPTATDGNYPVLIRDTDGDLYYYVNSSRLIDNVSISNNVWYHVAICREEGTTTRLYLDGVLKASATDSTNYITDDINISSYKTGGNYFHGYISNLRICKGHAVYTENFTVPTRELEVHLGAKGVVFPAADNRTVLLACQSSTDVTAEATGRHTLTANGDATAADANPGLLRKTNVTSTITENTGSVYFDGPTDGNATATDSIIIPSSPDFNWGTGDFTSEIWVYGTDWTGGASNQDQVIYYHNEEVAGFYTRAGALHYYNDVFVVSGPTLEDARWYHLAAVRQSGTLTLYVDGVSQGSASHTDDYGEGGITIGKNSGNNKNQFRGYLSNFRICKGHAVYTSNFAPPTRELEVHEGPDDDRTVFLGFYDGENIFADKTGRHIIAANGDRLSSPTPTATDSPIGITTNYPPVTRNVDPTAGPTFQGGVGFVSQNWLTLPKGTTTERNRTGGRGVFMGGYTTSPSNSAVADIHYINIQSEGNSIDFGNLVNAARWAGGSCGSSTRAIYGGGSTPGNQTHMDYVTIATTSDAVDYADLSEGRGYLKACSSSTRGIWAGGRTPTTSRTIDYVTIATLGGTATDYGDLSSASGRAGLQALSSPTRAIFAGGYSTPSPNSINIIDYISINSGGTAATFGNLTVDFAKYGDSASDGTRGVLFGGNTTPGPNTDSIQYLTISTLGNTIDFGDLSEAKKHVSGSSNSIRGLCAGGVTPTYRNTIDYITIQTTGDAQDFGDLSRVNLGYAGGTSDSHGGLS